MADFPNLIVKPSGELGFRPSEVAKNSDLRTATESGYVITRKRYSRVPNVLSCDYSQMLDPDYQLLIEFIALVGTSGNFNWIHPVTGETHDVRFLERPEFVYRGLHWYTAVELEEL